MNGAVATDLVQFPVQGGGQTSEDNNNPLNALLINCSVCAITVDAIQLFCSHKWEKVVLADVNNGSTTKIS